MDECKCKAKPQVLAWKNGKWHADVKALFEKLKHVIVEADLNEDALKSLEMLSYEVALLCLGKVRDEKSPIRNMNKFIVENAAHLRNQWGLDDAASSSSSEGSEDEEEGAGPAPKN